MINKTLQDKHGNPVADSLRFTIDIAIPHSLSIDAYQEWSSYLTESPSWPEFDPENIFFSELDLATRIFINSHLCLWQTFFELGRLPIFDIFQVQSVILKDPVKKIYGLEVDFLKLDSISLNAYQIPVGVSLKIARWMSSEVVTQHNLQALYKTIDVEIIQAMHRLVPGGQSTIPALKVAYQLGIPYMHLSQGVYQLGWGSKAQYLDRSSCAFDSMMGAKLSQNKVSTTHLLKLAGLPAPDHIIVYGEQDTLAAAKAIGYPVVVKPADQDRGEGVTVGIEDKDVLLKAFATAQRISESKQVIVERHVPGVCHRLFIVGNYLLYAVKRRPMGVIGDGLHTVKELVRLELAKQYQKPSWARSKLQDVDTLALDSIQSVGLTIDAVPTLNQFVPLRSIESTQWGGVDEDMTDVIHPANIEAAIEATQSLNLHISGVDIISTDIRLPWYENGAIINEVNHAPLLGGAEISRSYLPKFFKMLFPDTSKIPVDVFNDQAMANERLNFYKQQKLRTYFVSAAHIQDPLGRTIVMPITDLRMRIKALMSRRSVDAIVALM